MPRLQKLFALAFSQAERTSVVTTVVEFIKKKLKNCCIMGAL